MSREGGGGRCSDPAITFRGSAAVYNEGAESARHPLGGPAEGWDPEAEVRWLGDAVDG